MFGEPLYDYFGVGARLVYLRHVREKTPVHGQGFAKNVVELFISDIHKFPFSVTRGVSDQLQHFLEEIKDKPENSVLSKEEAKKLAKIADDITPVFEAESKQIMTVVLVEKRFEIGKLMSGVHTLMKPGAYAALPKIGKTDLDEAGKCLALNRSTAAAFHCLRATEAMLRELYLHFITRKRLKRPMWFDMVDALRKKKTNKPDSVLLDHLDMIRRNFRNPTQHPDKVYDIDEAQDLFANCITAINMMVDEVKKTTKTKP